MKLVDLDRAELPGPGEPPILVRINGHLFHIRSTHTGVWDISERLGNIHIGHGHLHTVGTLYRMVTPTGIGPKHPRWQHVLTHHVTVRSDPKHHRTPKPRT